MEWRERRVKNKRRKLLHKGELEKSHPESLQASGEQKNKSTGRTCKAGPGALRGRKEQREKRVSIGKPRVEYPEIDCHK